MTLALEAFLESLDSSDLRYQHSGLCDADLPTSRPRCLQPKSINGLKLSYFVTPSVS
jgi:hypothetical protein